GVPRRASEAWTMTSPWTTSADLRAQVLRYWDRGELLRARLDGFDLFPMALRLSRPDPQAIGAQFDEVRSWIAALERDSRDGDRAFYEITWGEINHRQIGRNRFPKQVAVLSERDGLAFIGRDSEARKWEGLVA